MKSQLQQAIESCDPGRIYEALQISREGADAAKAVINNDLVSLRRMLDLGAPMETYLGWGTALHHAIHLKNHDAVNLLLQHGARREAKTEKGYTALGLAVFHHDNELVKLLTQSEVSYTTDRSIWAYLKGLKED